MLSGGLIGLRAGHWQFGHFIIRGPGFDFGVGLNYRIRVVTTGKSRDDCAKDQNDFRHLVNQQFWGCFDDLTFDFMATVVPMPWRLVA